MPIISADFAVIFRTILENIHFLNKDVPVFLIDKSDLLKLWEYQLPSEWSFALIIAARCCNVLK